MAARSRSAECPPSVYACREIYSGLFTLRSYGSIRAMDTDTLQHQLAACIRAALAQRGFARPMTPDTSITDAYATNAAEAVLRHLQGAGWVLVPAASEMGAAELEETLLSSLRFPLLMAQIPPRTRTLSVYHAAVAEAVVKHLLQGGWRLAPALVKKPPTPRHSTSNFMSVGD